MESISLSIGKWKFIPELHFIPDMAANVYQDEQILEAIRQLRLKYGVVGLEGKYMLATDIDGDLRIAPVGILDEILWDRNVINPCNFIKVKELVKS